MTQDPSRDANGEARDANSESHFMVQVLSKCNVKTRDANDANDAKSRTSRGGGRRRQTRVAAAECVRK